MTGSKTSKAGSGAERAATAPAAKFGLHALFDPSRSEKNGSFSDTDSAALLAEAEKVRDTTVFRMKFPERVEACFQALQDESRRKILLYLVPASSLVHLLFLASDRLMFPDVFWISVWVKTFINIPLTVLFYVLTLRRMVNMNVLVAAFATAIQLQIIFMMFQSAAPQVGSLVYTLALICVVCNSAYVPDFRLVVFMTGQAIIELLVIMLYDQNVSQATNLFVFGTSLFLCIYSLVGAFRIEMAQRNAYILGLREKLRADLLSVANRKLIQQVDYDGLTGVHNRRYFDQSLKKLWDGHLQSETSLGFLLIDIDHFKALNDAHGHLVGDLCLQQVAAAMLDEIRGRTDILARFGGEEFVVLLPDADLNVSFEVAERLRRKVEQLRIQLENKAEPVRITVSIGCHAMVPTQGKLAEKFVADADEALYHAKKTGRNLVSTRVMKQSLAEAEMRMRNRLNLVGNGG